jgi:ribosome-binding protein aMBF1 (putative translation factor)
MSQFQDWEPVVLRKSDPKQVTKKPVDNIKIDNEDEVGKIIKVDSEFSKQIIQARLAKKLNQIQLAKALSLDVSVIKEYENGTAKHNGMIVSQIKKYLGINKNTAK